MTARQQVARLLPLVLLVVLVIVGLRGVVSAPRWDGPLKADGTAIGVALEVVFIALLVAVRRRAAAARHQSTGRPYDPAHQDRDVDPATALRFTLTAVLLSCIVGVAVVLLANLHLKFFSAARRPPAVKTINPIRLTPSAGPHGGGGSLHIPLGPILYALLIIAIVAAVVVSIWWSTRLRRPASPLVIEDVSTAEDLREAVDEGRAALAGVDDARAAIIACYVAMERRLADRGTARGAADTPDELLGRAVAAGTVRGGAARRLTALFYEARFSTHPLGAGQRDAASAALDELAAELKAKPQQTRPADSTTADSTTGDSTTADNAAGRPGGGWV